jgi:bifunctional DNA-binding transcriptional regulator/antitoxin component of YhaV-PrlF toxin-antitoxin module
VVIPAAYRRQLGLRVRDEVILVLENGGLRVLTPHQAIKEAQALVRRHVPAGTRLADELIAERQSQPDE